MRTASTLLVASLALGCRPDDAPPAQDSSRPEDTAPRDTGVAPPLDRDSDGYTEDLDCDDRDPRISPAVAEVWNGVDDDCDGFVDADGTWSGSVTLDASAVYEGRRYDFRLTCPFAGARSGADYAFTITCEPDPSDTAAQRLLGATLTVTPDDARAADAAWSGDVLFTSSNGWDSTGTGSTTWDAFDAATVRIEQSGVSLTASGSGPLTRSGG